MCEIGYDGACGTELADCQCKPVSNLLSLSQDMLSLLEDSEGGDVTLLLRGEYSIVFFTLGLCVRSLD